MKGSQFRTEGTSMQHCWLRGGSNRTGLVTFGKLSRLIGLVRGGFHTSPAWPRGQLRTARLGEGTIYSKAGQERAGLHSALDWLSGYILYCLVKGAKSFTDARFSEESV